MLDRFFINISNIDKIGLLILVLAGFITYGAKFIAQSVFKVQSDRMFKIILIIKIVGLLIGIFGFIKITRGI